MHALLNFSLQKLNVYNVLLFLLMATTPTPRGCTRQAPGKSLKVVVTCPPCECHLSDTCDCGSRLAILRNLLSPPPTPLPPLLLVELEAPCYIYKLYWLQEPGRHVSVDDLPGLAFRWAEGLHLTCWGTLVGKLSRGQHKEQRAPWRGSPPWKI